MKYMLYLTILYDIIFSIDDIIFYFMNNDNNNKLLFDKIFYQSIINLQLYLIG